MNLNSEIENKIKQDSLILKENITKLKGSLSLLKRQISENPFSMKPPQTSDRANHHQYIKQKNETDLNIKEKKKKKENTKAVLKTYSNSKANICKSNNANVKSRPKSNERSKKAKTKHLNNNPKPKKANKDIHQRLMTPVNKVVAKPQIRTNHNKDIINKPKPKKGKLNKPKPKSSQINNELELLRKENTFLKQKLQTESTKNDQLIQMIDNLNSQFT